VIENFEGDWKKEWFTYRPEDWARRTHKIYDDKWKAPPYAKLALEVRSAEPNKLVVRLDDFVAEAQLKGDGQWQEVVLFPVDFQDVEGGSFLEWSGLRELSLSAKETLRSGRGPARKTRVVGADWKGPDPTFRNLRWVKGTKEELNARRTIKLPKTARESPIYLTPEYADFVSFGMDPIHFNPKVHDIPLEVYGKTYEYCMTLHAPSEATFFLGGKYARFRAIAVPGRVATVEFKVIVDDKEVFKSGLLKGRQLRIVDLPLKDAQEIKLIITDGGNGKSGDWAHWVDAWVVGAND